jgi:hypothetical protein
VRLQLLLLLLLLLLQGVVSSAEELHALEEQTFQQWQQTLLHTAAAGASSTDSCDAAAAAAAAVAAAGAGAGTARAGGVGRLSFYEGRLEFWRQLWRTLEMSDLVLMIVDARWVCTGSVLKGLLERCVLLGCRCWPCGGG